MIKAIRKRKIDSLFMPCIYFIHCVFCAFGSFFFKYRYSLIWRRIPMVEFLPKFTAKGRKNLLKIGLLNPAV